MGEGHPQLVMLFTAITFLITYIFNADVEAQGGAYATGVLVLMTSAAVAVTLSKWNRGTQQRLAFSAVTLVFVYTPSPQRYLLRGIGARPCRFSRPRFQGAFRCTSKRHRLLHGCD